MTPAGILAAAVASGALAAPSRAPRVLVAPYSGIITPVAAEFLGSALRKAADEGFDAALIQLDTPGGLDLSMRAIVKDILSSKVPVIVFVNPAGARAASAGVFIAMAANVAAMTPGTNIGAAHPVSMAVGGRGKAEGVLEGKIRSDTAAYLRSIAQKRGRNEAWAEEAVIKSASISASDAVRMKVVDLVADDMPSLLRAVDGLRLPGLDAPLRTAGAGLERMELTRRQRWLAALSDPNVAMMLMSLGGAGLLIELYSPGLILPGIVGAVSLLMAFYSFQTLSASYAGVLLILAGLAFFLLEIKVSSYGMLAVGGAAATSLGTLMLFSENVLGGLEVSREVLWSTLGGMLALTAVVSRVVYSALRRSIPTGEEGMVGARGVAVTDVSSEGRVRIGGETWEAFSSEALRAGEHVRVVGVEGLRLKVRRG